VPCTHNARTIAALTRNPACHRRAVLDAAGVDKRRLAEHLGVPVRFGQSQFALARGNGFEASVKSDGCARLVRLLRDELGLPVPDVSYRDLNRTSGVEGRSDRYDRSRAALARALESADGVNTLFDHPLLRLDVAGRWAYLEPDLAALRLGASFYVIEIKSFPVIDGRADPGKVAAAAVQSAVYVLAMRELVEDLGLDPLLVSHEVFLVCPADFSNRPTAARLDVRKQLASVQRQLSRLTRLDSLVGALPDDLTFNLHQDADGKVPRPVNELAAALGEVAASYAPECLAACEMAYFCRAESQGLTSALGRSVRDDLGGVDTVQDAVALAVGAQPPTAQETEAARILQLAELLRRQSLGLSA
jgi:hypothetical protein